MLDEAGRTGRLGGLIECPLCDRGEPAVGEGGVADEGGVPDEGGEAACYAHLLCPECAVVLEPGARHRAGCPAAAGRND